MRFPGRKGHGSGLQDGSRVVVVGAGPAGCFFAVRLLRTAKQTGRAIDLVMIEKKRGLTIEGSLPFANLCAGCNRGAGSLSPRICDILDELGITVPERVIQSRVESLTVQGHWKNVAFAVPPGSRMLSVFRGSLPATRMDRAASFDALLLEHAVAEGARLIHGEVRDVTYSERLHPVVHYHRGSEAASMEADFVALATGVNQGTGSPSGERDPFRSLRTVLPGFTPPRLRKTIVGEVRVPERVLVERIGEVYYLGYGSADLRLEMCNIIPKAELVTVVLIGDAVDRAADRRERMQILGRFLSLPHVRKLLPGPHSFACSCGPSIVTGISRGAIGDRVAVIGDLATCRLNKDGMYSAHRTATALAETVLTQGPGEASLRRTYWPVAAAIARDNLFGKVVFLLHRITFSNPILSRVLYQALFTERKTRDRSERRLERILWSITSGSADYRRILRSMAHPAAAWSIATGGALVTLRNYLAELFFGLSWSGFERHATGVYKELLAEKRQQFRSLISSNGAGFPRRQDFERIYTIRIRAPADRIFAELSRFGDEDRAYFRPRLIGVKRVRGEPNREGSVMQYTVASRLLTFNLTLEHAEPGRHLVYRVLDGFARGGVMVFEIEGLTHGYCALSIYVTFDFSAGPGILGRPVAVVLQLLFPGFAHDVVWNHSLCQLKDCVEGG